jgi:O-antigen/teichoic acid export membrane protein
MTAPVARSRLSRAHTSLVQPFRQPSTLARRVFGTAGANIFLAAVGGLGGVVLARALGPTDRGRLVPVVIWPAFLGSFASLGITQAVTYFVSAERERADEFVATGGLTSLLTGLLLAAVAWPLAQLLGAELHVQKYLFVVLLASPVYIVAGFWNSALQAVSIFQFNVTRAIQPTLYFLAIAAAFVAGELTIPVVVGGLLFAQVAMLVYTFAVTRHDFHVRTHPTVAAARSLYSYGVRVFLGFTPRAINIYLDQLLLSATNWVSAAELGNYAVAASLSALVLPLSSAFGTVAFPAVAASTTREQGRRIERAALRGALVTAAAIVGALAVAAPVAIPFVFGSGFEDAVVAFWILAPGSICLAMNQVMGDILRGRGLPLRAAAGEATGAVATVIALPVLAPVLGINGAAAVSSAAYGVATVVLVLGLRRTAAPADA